MTAQDDNKKQQQPKVATFVSAGHGKESAVSSAKTELVTEVSKEVELPTEVKEAGVEHLHGSIELPPDIKKLGVSASGVQTQVQPPAVTVTLPIQDDKIFDGSKAPVTSSIKWLATWCLKRLKFAHLILKKIHGKIVRVTVN